MDAYVTFNNILENIKNSNLTSARTVSLLCCNLFEEVFSERQVWKLTVIIRFKKCCLDHCMKSENRKLKQKISDVESDIISLKADYANAVDECEEALKAELEAEIEYLKP